MRESLACATLRPVFLVKLWAKNYDVNDATNGGGETRRRRRLIPFLVRAACAEKSLSTLKK